MALLGIDLGTSSVKALLTSAGGRILGSGSMTYAIDRPQPGWAEQSPETWWQATVQAVRIAFQAAGTTADVVEAMGLSGQMHGTVLLGHAGNVLAPAVIWPDRRSRRQVREIGELIGTERLIRLTGSPLATGFQAATLRWLQEERPELWSQVAAVLTPKDYLRWRLTGEFGAEPSDGSGTLLLDVNSRDWSPELLDALAIDPALLPEVRPSSAVAGYLVEGEAEQLGVPPGIPVVNGAADTACGLLGAGVVDEGALLLTISSGGQLAAPAGQVEIDLGGRLHAFCSALEPTGERPGWYQMGAILSAGLSLRWLRDQVFEMKDDGAYERLTALAETAPPGAGGLLFLPYLLGERTPHMDPAARGMFLGLTTEHGRAEMVRAVMEGVVLACYDVLTVLKEVGTRPEYVVLAGGGARSTLWRQIVANVFNLPVRALATGEQAAVGAALLAGSGLGLFDPLTMAKQWAGYEPKIEPDARANEIYGRLLPIYRTAYQKHKADFVELWSI